MPISTNNVISTKENIQIKTNSKNNADNKPSNNEKIKTATKLMIGATALAAVVVGGVLLHKGNVARKAAKEADEELKKIEENASIERSIVINTFKGKASEEEITAKLAEIDKLPPNERIVAYKRLSSVAFKDIEALKFARKGDFSDLKRGMQEIPSDVKEAMDKGYWIKAVELYESHVQKLPETFKTKCCGNTVEETIANLPWAKSKVKPHTYDLSKEGEEIVSCTYHGKYHQITTTKEGVLHHDVKQKTSLSYDSADVFPKGSSPTISSITGGTITHGLSEDGKYVTIIKTNDGIGNTSLGLISKTDKPSPAQEDLLSLIEHPERFNQDLIKNLCDKTGPRPESAPYFDYDLALSIIQSMAKG